MNSEQMAQLTQVFNLEQMEVLSSVLGEMQPKPERPIWERQSLQSPFSRVKSLDGNLPKIVFATGENQYQRLILAGWIPAQSDVLNKYERLKGVSGDIVMAEVNRTKQSKSKAALLKYYGDFKTLDDIPEEYHAELGKRRKAQIAEAQKAGLIQGVSPVVDSVKELEAADKSRLEGNLSVRKKRTRKTVQPDI